jgi:hypothetical protein
VQGLCAIPNPNGKRHIQIPCKFLLELSSFRAKNIDPPLKYPAYGGIDLFLVGPVVLSGVSEWNRWMVHLIFKERVSTLKIMCQIL